MFYQPVNPQVVLIQKFDKEDFKFYARIFLPFVIFMLVFPVIYLIPRILSPDADIKAVLIRTGIMTGRFFILLVGCIIFLIIFSSIGKKKYNKNVAKYGFDILAAQLSQPDNVVAYIHPTKYESYVIITRLISPTRTLMRSPDLSVRFTLLMLKVKLPNILWHLTRMSITR